jgi:hypothetical protein
VAQLLPAATQVIREIKTGHGVRRQDAAGPLEPLQARPVPGHHHDRGVGQSLAEWADQQAVPVHEPGGVRPCDSRSLCLRFAKVIGEPAADVLCMVEPMPRLPGEAHSSAPAGNRQAERPG